MSHWACEQSQQWCPYYESFILEKSRYKAWGCKSSASVQEFKVSVWNCFKGQVAVVLAEAMGYCWGVERAVQMAYEAVNAYPERKLHLTNEIIHNPGVNQVWRAQHSTLLIESLPGKNLLQLDFLACSGGGRWASNIVVCFRHWMRMNCFYFLCCRECQRKGTTSSKWKMGRRTLVVSKKGMLFSCLHLVPVSRRCRCSGTSRWLIGPRMSKARESFNTCSI